MSRFLTLLATAGLVIGINAGFWWLVGKGVAMVALWAGIAPENLETLRLVGLAWLGVSTAGLLLLLTHLQLRRSRKNQADAKQRH